MKYYAFAQLTLLAVAAFFGFIFWRYLIGNSAFDISRDLKEKTPLGLPARAIDSGISAATGRDETLGGLFAEWFDPATRAANEMMRTPPILPHDKITEDYSTPFFYGAP